MKAVSLKIRAVTRFSLRRENSRKKASTSVPHDNHNEVQRGPISRAQALPREVLQAILFCLSLSIYAESFPFNYGSEIWDCQTNYPQIRAISHTLYCITLVCRSWYAAGTPILYSVPALFTGRRIQSFKRTLEQVPSMSRHVKTVLLVDIEGTGVTPLRVFQRLGKFQQQVLEDLVIVLNACRSLQGIVISVQSGWMSTMGCSLLTTSSIGRSLRKLTVYGDSLQSSFSELELPSLEILCLRNFPYSSQRLIYPLMPRLHTLQLAITYVGSNIQFAFRKGSPIPPLKSLEFYGAHAYGTLIDEDSLSYFDTLEQLYLVGREEILTFLELSKSESPISIRHLALGIIPSFFNHLEDWQIPSTLETLTFFVDLVPVRRGSLLSDKRSLTIIYNFLRSNIDQLSSGSFRLLVINAISDFANVINDPRQYLLGQGGQDDPLVFVNLKDTSPGFVFDQINDLCDSVGVDVHLNHIDIDDWVARRLRDTDPIE